MEVWRAHENFGEGDIRSEILKELSHFLGLNFFVCGIGFNDL